MEDAHQLPSIECFDCERLISSPTAKKLLDELGLVRFFSKHDLTSGFHQIRLQPQDMHKMFFHTHDVHSEYRVMSFGLCITPTTFQATMNEISRPLLHWNMIVFFDDILVYSASGELHREHLA